MDWADYHDLDTLNEFITALADANDFASIIPIGQSYEGREMNVLAITKVCIIIIKYVPNPTTHTRQDLELPTSGLRLEYTLGNGLPLLWPLSLSGNS